MASLTVRAFMDMCMIRNLSCFVLFIDFSKAFDLAIREVVMGWMESMKSKPDSEKEMLLGLLGVPAAASGRLVQWINDTGGLLR